MYYALLILPVVATWVLHRTRVWWLGGALPLAMAGYVAYLTFDDRDPWIFVAVVVISFLVMYGVACFALGSWARGWSRARPESARLPVATVVAVSKDSRHASDSAW